MTTYSYTVSFDDCEAICIENMFKEEIAKFKIEHADDGLPVPWVWESILEKLKKADTKLMSWSNFSKDETAKYIKSTDE